VKLLLAFLVAAFVVGGSTGGPAALRRPIVLVGACFMVGMMLYSKRLL